MAVTTLTPKLPCSLGNSKPLPADWRRLFRLRPKRGHGENHLDLTGDDGNQFRLILSSRLFRLRRNNGRNHQHTNSVEGDTFYDYHIHTATERYQEVGSREDAYAEATDRYSDLTGAVDCMLEDAGFYAPISDQLSFF